MTLRDTRESAPPTTPKVEFSAAEIGALAHLYRGEVYRSTVWRTRLDSTTNWAVVTTGTALSAQYGSIALAHGARRPHRQRVSSPPGSPPLPVFQRLAGTRTFAGDRLLRADDQRRRHSVGAGWAELLAKDYCDPRYHIGFVREVGRRLRRTYAWIFVIQAVAYYGKLAIHPMPLTTHRSESGLELLIAADPALARRGGASSLSTVGR